MDKVRIGLIGYGGMGSSHAKYIFNDEVPGAELVAVCDISPKYLKSAEEAFGEKVRLFDDVEAFFKSKTVDAVLIATVHYQHPPLAIKAFEHGLHVLTEKPAGVYTKHVREMNAVAAGSGKVFGVMFNQRTLGLHRKLKDLVDSGELGGMKRNNWIVTEWYRSQSYYDAGTWRASWAGEGGGVLLNQCPHNLDLWQWICGMPKRVRAFCSFGKYHDIEVEDDVTAYVEYENGATGVFIASTGEAPGSNRFEMAGDNGKIVLEGGKIAFWRNRVPERQFNREFKGGFGEPECWKCDIPVIDQPDHNQHREITRNWTEAILKDTPLLAPGDEGINSMELANAMLLSAWTDDWVDLPIDDDLYYEKLQEKIKGSTFKKAPVEDKVLDVESSY